MAKNTSGKKYIYIDKPIGLYYLFLIKPAGISIRYAGGLR
jgi:hypothetical protein